MALHYTDLATPLSTPSTTSCRGVFIQPLGFSYCHFSRLTTSTRLVTQPRSTSTGLFHCCQQLAHRLGTTWSPSYPSFSSKLQELRSTDVSKVPELRDIAIERSKSGAGKEAPCPQELSKGSSGSAAPVKISSGSSSCGHNCDLVLYLASLTRTRLKRAALRRFHYFGT